MFYLDFRGELAVALVGTAILVVLGVLALMVIAPGFPAPGRRPRHVR